MGIVIKRSHSFFIFLTKLLIILSLYTTNAQEGFMGGLGPSLELNENFAGINGRFFYGVNKHVCFGPEVTYFPFQSLDEEAEVSILDANINIHYVFELNHKLGIYPLTGINYTFENERFELDTEEKETEEEFGLNYGFGAHYNLNSLFVFAEFKGIISPLNDTFITVGAIFPLFQKNETTDKKH